MSVRPDEVADPLPVGDRARVRAEVLAARVERHLQAQGFRVRDGRLIGEISRDKEVIRGLHAAAVRTRRDAARPALARHEQRLVAHLLAGRNLDPRRIDPALVPVDGSANDDARLWRWCALHWSIPVSSGYGRRLRFLIVDRAHDNAIIGLIGLADPVFGLASRDAWIGWNRELRQQKLACVMDAFVLGAVPPYAALCGGKLAALLATSEQVRRAFVDRYGHRTTLIARRDPEADLALVTTSSALGRSSIYNRLTTPDGKLAFWPAGYTKGTGDFHLTGELYEELARHARDITPANETYRHPRWPRGTFRNRREVIERALQDIGLNGKILRTHGIRRQVFCAPLASNSREWLRGECAELKPDATPVRDLADWWVHRWAIPRSTRVSDWRSFEPREWRIWPS